MFHIIKSTKNWAEVLFVWLGIKKQAVAYFRNGQSFAFGRTAWHEYVYRAYLYSLLPSARLIDNKVKFQYHGRELVFECGKWGFNTILEIFGGDPYRDFLKVVSPKDKQVVNIGAAFGDTAIYFLLEGAKRVYAFEALPSYFRLAEENLRINGFSDFCDLSLSAVGKASGSIFIDPNFGDMFGSERKPFTLGEKVPMITLSQIVERFSINDGFLKLDVEGYEYDILLNTPAEILRRFSDMLIEYHYGFERLEGYLAAVGFSVSHTRPHKSAGEDAKNMRVGHIIAKRRAATI